ncbi:MAG: 30S ribosomal protein S20, partial [Thermoleophilia bacterium]
MPNIRQQKKRVRITARQRLENLRYRSTVKTLARRLREAVAGGDEERIAAAHRELVRWLDK